MNLKTQDHLLVLLDMNCVKNFRPDLAKSLLTIFWNLETIGDELYFTWASWHERED